MRVIAELLQALLTAGVGAITTNTGTRDYPDDWISVPGCDRFEEIVFADYGDYIKFLQDEVEPEDARKDIQRIVSRVLSVIEMRKRGWCATLDEEDCAFRVVVLDKKELRPIHVFSLDEHETDPSPDEMEKVLIDLGFKDECIGREDNRTGDLFQGEKS